ncbi:hypothetical protein K7X08_036682 [Anisodus acutangulus]|uniref:Uncharacterized protein n=1 Tax=Anisodus acutangulus TaxID=402998 RepID=A0A9Q1L6G6_9SOLA|nr:hypothetical protein K7X08_036682 [Anisodus acutangulus]
MARNKVRDKRIKAQREQQKEIQIKKAVDTKRNEDFHTVNRKKGARTRNEAPPQYATEGNVNKIIPPQANDDRALKNQTQPAEKHQVHNNQRNDLIKTSNKYKGITINEPSNNMPTNTMIDVPGSSVISAIKKTVEHPIIEGKKNITIHQEADEQHNEVIQQKVILQDNETNSNMDPACVIDHGDMHNNYLKLISGTSLEEDSGPEYDGNQSDSSFEEEKFSSEDLNYVEESSDTESEEYASVVNSEDLSEDQNSRNNEMINDTGQINLINETDEDNSDDNADKLVKTFSSQILIDVNVASEFDN